MKKTKLLIIVLLISSFKSYSQTEAKKDSSWKTGGIIGLAFNQVSLSNWAAGGENSISLTTLFTGFANYKKDKWAWDNGILLAYGLNKIGTDDAVKNDDRIEIQTKPGYEIKKSWYISYLFNFRSQFAPGYDENFDPKVKTSEFLSPAYLVNSLGIEYKPNDDFYFYVSPLTVKSTLVYADSTVVPHTLYGVDQDKNARNEFGFFASIRYKKEIMTNVTLATKLDLFSNYSEDPQNVDLNWELLLSMKVNKFLTATLGLQAIYDDNILVPKGTDDNGIPIYGQGLQFKEFFGAGFTYNFGAAELPK